MSGKSSDSHAVPLLHRVHVELHRNGDEKAFLANYGIADAEALAQKIYDNTGDFEACIQIIGEKQ
jgi:hypothetical protein